MPKSNFGIKWDFSFTLSLEKHVSEAELRVNNVIRLRCPELRISGCEEDASPFQDFRIIWYGKRQSKKLQRLLALYEVPKRVFPKRK